MKLAPDGVDAVIDCIGSDEAVDVSLALVDDRDADHDDRRRPALA